MLGDGGIYSNVEDMAKWDRAPREHTLLRPAEMQAAFTPVKAPGGAKTEDGTPTEYGFGWFLDTYNGRKRTWHSGTTTGFRTFIDRFTDEELTIIICAIATTCGRAVSGSSGRLVQAPVSPLCGTWGGEILKISRAQ